MRCKRCSNEIKEIDMYCRKCGLKTDNDDSTIQNIDIDLNEKLNKLNYVEEEKKKKGKSKMIVPIIFGVVAILILLIIVILLIYNVSFIF